MISHGCSERWRPRMTVSPKGSRLIVAEHSDGGGVAGEHAARRRHRLQSRRHVHDVAHGGVVEAGQRAHEHLAGVDPDAHLHRRCVAAGGGEQRQRLLHPQRRPHGPLGVVLVGDRGAEQRDDGVAEQLVDLAAEGLDVGHEPLEAAVDQALDPLRVEVLGQRGRADEVGEQDGDDPPLLGEPVGHGRAAVAAEPSPRGHRVRAHCAGDHGHDPRICGAAERGASLGCDRKVGASTGRFALQPLA